MRIMDWSSDVCSSVLSFRNQHKRSLHWLGSRVLLRTLLNTDKYINLKIDEYRKPFLANLPHQVSISHSYDFAAVMVSLNGPVGVDIEQINSKIEKIAASFLLPEELEFIYPQARLNRKSVVMGRS